FHRHHEDLAVADPAGARRALDRFDDLGGLIVGNDDLELNLGKKIDYVLGPTVEFGMALLAAESFYFANREPLHADTRERLFDLVKLERLDDRVDLLHMTPPGTMAGRTFPS